MNTGYELWVARRYLRVRGRELFVSVIAWISVAGVAVGVMALTVVLAVMAGFEGDLREKILGANPHLKVLPARGEGLAGAEKIAAAARELPGVTAASPFVERKMILATPGSVQGVVFRGIGPEERFGLSSLDGALKRLHDGRRDGLVVGAEMARTLGLLPGDRVRLMNPSAAVTPAGPVPRIRSYTVVGVFQTGMYEYDTSWVFTRFDEAADFLRMGEKAGGVDLRLADAFEAPATAALLRERLGPEATVRDWTEMNRSLFGALKLEKLAMFLFLGLTVVVAAFNIASTLIMVVLDKARDIGVLKSLGAGNRSILKIFLLKGCLIGATGTAVGTAAGVAAGLWLKNSDFIRLPEDVYYIQTIPVVLEPATIAAVAFSSVILCLLAALYPAWQASRLDPVESLRYE